MVVDTVVVVVVVAVMVVVVVTVVVVMVVTVVVVMESLQCLSMVLQSQPDFVFVVIVWYLQCHSSSYWLQARLKSFRPTVMTVPHPSPRQYAAQAAPTQSSTKKQTKQVKEDGH